MNEQEYPDYVGFYFRDYYQILEQQARKGTNTPDIFELDISSDMNFVSFNQSEVIKLDTETSQNNLKYIKNNIHKYKQNQANFKSFNISDMRQLSNKEDDYDHKLIIESNNSLGIHLPMQSDEMKKKNHEHVIHCAQGLKACKGKELPKGVVQLGNKEILQKNHNDHFKLLVFDLDETLMHTVHHFEDDDIQNHKIDKEYDYKLPIFNSNGKTKYICINMRPYVKEILKLLKKHYRIAVFTASISSYADAILNFIDPHNEIFEARYYRTHCLTTKERIHIKDMKLFEQPNSKNDKNWSLSDIVMIDNASHSFAFQVNNGYPILPFYTDKQDKEMIHLYYFLLKLAKYEDVRPVLAKTFVLEKLLQERISELIEGIIEYSVQEMTDEDILLFDKFLSDKTEQPQENSLIEQEQGQSLESIVNFNQTDTDENYEEIVDVFQIEEEEINQENFNSNKSSVTIPKERYSIEINNIKKNYHITKNTKQYDINKAENNDDRTFRYTNQENSPRKTRIGQKLEEYRKKYLGTKYEEKESPLKKKASTLKNNFVTPNNKITAELINNKREGRLTITNKDPTSSPLNEEFSNVQVLSSNISRGESCLSQREWSKTKERRSEIETPKYIKIAPPKRMIVEAHSKTLKEKHRYRTNRNKTKRG